MADSSAPDRKTTRASDWRRGLRLPARAAAVLLLLVWVGPVTLTQTDSWRLLKLLGAPGRASAESNVIPAGMAVILQPNAFLRLFLHDGSSLEGRFLARTLLDSTSYAPRFAAHTRSSSYVPLAMGETLHVSLRDGREWTAPFAGYGELTLLLRSPEGREFLRVPFESALEIRRATGDRVEPSDLAQAFRSGLLPSAEALEIQVRSPTGGGVIRVPVEDIATVTLAEMPSAATPTRSLSGDQAVGIVLLSVVVAVVVVFVIIGAAYRSAFNDCGSTGPSINLGPIGFHITTRPFDRSRRCFVGEPLAVADPWPGTECPSGMALANAAMSDR